MKWISLTLAAGLVMAALAPGCRQARDTALPAAPDYADSTQWHITDRHGAADVFYIISTETGDYLTAGGITRHHADTHNDSTRLPMLAEMIGVDTLLSGSLNFYSPFYRQCSLQSFAGDSLETRMAVSTDDVRRAFNHYLRHLNPDRPFVLAGFSAGAMIALELLREMDDDTFGRMIAAYAIGVTITDADVAGNPRLAAASGADDTGVTVCYNSVRDPGCAVFGLGNAFAINPVNWLTDTTAATLVTEPSPLLPVSDQTPDTLTVRLDRETRLLLVDGFTATDYELPLIGKPGCYHTREIWLYRKQLRDNIALRTARHLAAGNDTQSE